MTGSEIILGLDSVLTLFGLIERARLRAIERGEWTPEQEAKFIETKSRLISGAHWFSNDPEAQAKLAGALAKDGPQTAAESKS